MTNWIKTAGRVLAIASFLLLAACGAQTTPEPTVDQNLIFTAAAQTVAAQITNEAVMNPSPTATVQPTATIEPTQAPLPTLPSNLPTLPVPGQATLPVLATLPIFGTPGAPLPGLVTPTRAVVSTGDKAEWVSQNPADGALVVTGAKFDIIWRLKNTGTTTWTTDYKYRFFSAPSGKFHERNEYNLRQSVKPNDEIEVVVDAVAPGTPGEYLENWVLTNAQGNNFYTFNITIKVISPDQVATTEP